MSNELICQHQTRKASMKKWHNLYLHYGKVSHPKPKMTQAEHDAQSRIVQTLQEALATLGYELYNPFEQIVTRAYIRSVRLFVGPVVSEWARILGVTDERIIPAVASIGLCLSIQLDETGSQIVAYRDGGEVDLMEALKPHLRAGLTLADLEKALARPYPRMAPAADDLPVPAHVLPENVREMAQSLDSQRVNRWFARFLGRAGRHIAGDPSAAYELLTGDQVDWDAPGGQKIRAVMACLDVPDAWRAPDFVTLRDAYQLHLRRRNNPNAPLHPGDAEAMAAVPNALDYAPVYGGIVGGKL